MSPRIALLTITALALASSVRAEQPLRPYEGDHMESLPHFTRLAPAARAIDIVDFWEKAGPAKWFDKDPDFDRLFRERFLIDHEAAAIAFSRLSELAAAYQLTVYDAAYLELAQRRRLVLACADGPLRAAAKKAGVSLWQ